ncbi:MAG: cytidylate kinase-like family protein [Lachnospiraceae bacterium]|nr:cytidylate kinase-like family protein [Lachnospiraceae bacterium]
MNRTTIVIDREYGSGGREVARILSEKLGIAFYDGNLLIQAGEQSGINLSILRDYDERGVGSILHDLAMVSSCMSGDSKAEQPFMAYEAQARLMTQLVQQSPCIFLGRCAADILAGQTPLLRVFIYASNLTDRIDRAVNTDHIPEKSAPAYIRRKDQQRKNYQKYFTQKTWGEPANYDMMLNTSVLNYEKAADIIIAALDK